MEKYLHIKMSKDIKLSPLLESDAPDVLRLVNENRINLAKYLYWVKGVSDIASAHKYIFERVNSGKVVHDGSK